MKIKLIVFLLALFSAQVVQAKEVEDISESLKKILKGSKVPSLAAAAIHDGKIVARGATGIRKKGDKTLVTLEDKYHIGSCTKSMTATVGAMLIEEGKLKWETKVSEVFPEMDIHEDYQDATFEQLVTNTGGAPGDIEPGLWSELWERKGSEREQRMQLVKGILKHPPSYLPGTGEIYSNAGFSIAGAMMENILDQPYEIILEEKLFKPLGMTSAGFRAPASNGKVDQPYGHSKSLFRVVPAAPETNGDNPSAIAPANAVHCSVSDFARYALFHLGKMDESILSKETLEVLHEPAKGRDYAKGWLVMSRAWAKGRVLMHDGSNTMFYALIWIAPKQDFAAVALCNYGEEEGSKKCNEAIEYLIQHSLQKNEGE